MQTITAEDYIKAVYKLEQKGERATTSALAASLRLSNPSITDMIKKLAGKGYLQYAPYRGVELTAKGKKAALTIVRRHRLWEMFLVRFLDYSWDRVHEEAERLEHSTSSELERKMDKALGWPSVDPHGDPIPSAEGKIMPREDVPLAECSPGVSVRILRVSDHDGGILEHAARIGLTLNRRIFIKERIEFDRSMVVKIGSKERFVSEQLARAIFVRRV